MHKAFFKRILCETVSNAFLRSCSKSNFNQFDTKKVLIDIHNYLKAKLPLNVPDSVKRLQIYPHCMVGTEIFSILD